MCHPSWWVGIAIAVCGLWVAGCCGAASGDGGHEVSAPARPPGSHGLKQPVQPVQPDDPTSEADDDSAAGDDDSAGDEAATACDPPPFPLPDDAAVRADLAGRMFCYQGPELDGLYWTLADEEIRDFEVAAREACVDAGHVDVDLEIRGEHDSITGRVRLFYAVEGSAWAFQAIRRATVEDFEVEARNEVPAEVLGARELRPMSCVIVEQEGLCWEYSRELIRDQGRGPTREICKAWRGSLVDGGCPRENRLKTCAIEDSYLVHYYPQFEVENPFLSHRKHCEVSGGTLGAP